VPKLLDWAAVSADGQPLARREFIGTSNLPAHAVRTMEVVTNHPAAPRVRVKCSPEHDECIRVFTRRTMPFAQGGTTTDVPTDTVVIEIAHALVPGRFVRLYLKDGGIILSSEEVHG
jgi:hypothetical protein